MSAPTARAAVRTKPAPRPRERLAAGRILLGAIAIGVVSVAVVLAQDLFQTPLPTRIQDGLILAVSILIESLPFVLLGVLLSVVVQVWLPDGVIERWLPRSAWARRLVLSLFGMLIPVCECGNVPFARGLTMRGLTVPDTLTFLVAAPIVNPIVIITTHQAFGFDDGILVARIVGGFLIANLIGWLYSRHPDPASLLTPSFRAACEASEAPTNQTRAHRSVTQTIIELRAIMPALVIGSAIAGAIQVVIPRDMLLAIGSDPALSILAMTALAMVVAICSNVDAFFALSFASTFTPGSIVAFLLVGPLVDVKMLALMRTTFRTRVLVGLVAVVIPAAFVIASVVNLVA